MLPPEYILEYAEDKDKPLETIYPFVPVPLVERMLWEHGGRVTLSL